MHAELDSIDLGSLDENNKPVVSRLRDVTSALGIFENLRRADEKSSINRARIDSMFDGSAPYDQDKLLASGQGLKTNLNFGEAQRLLDISLSAYVDLYSSLESLIEVKSGPTAEQSTVGAMEQVVSEELTHMLRSWPEFHSSYLRLCTQFIKHGVGIAYFDSPEDWRFRVGGFTDILIPRQTPASENAIDIAVGRREYHLHELFHFIKNPQAATKIGWDVNEVRRVIKENASSSGRRFNGASTYSDYESLEAELKNNDLFTGLQNPSVAILHFWVREMDGTVSHFIAAEDKPKDFLYKKISKFKSPDQAYIFFTHGVGSNGTYHSVRGLGQKIFAHVQTSNRLRCQQIDGAMLGSAVMIQPDSQRALDELDFTYYGAYAILSPGLNIIEKGSADLGKVVKPALDDLTQQLQLNTDTVSTYGPSQTSPYRNQMQVASDMDVSTRLSGSSLNLFYMSWTRLMREFVRRVVNAPKEDDFVRDFYRRCAERGIPKEFIKRLDLSRTIAVRSIGNGSKAGRLVALREMQGLSGRLDEVGRKNLDRDIISTTVGHDLANRYLPISAEPRPTVDVKIAFLENQQLTGGNPVPVVSNEMHGIHLETHMPALAQIIEGIETGEVDPQGAIGPLQALYQHISDTAQAAAGDVNLENIVSEANQLLQFAEEQINNTFKALQKIQRDQAQAQEQEQAPQEGGQAPQEEDQAPTVDLKVQEAEVKMDIARRKAELDMEIRQRKFDQEMAIRDAQAAMKFRESGTV
jgi:hypothetical protein